MEPLLLIVIFVAILYILEVKIKGIHSNGNVFLSQFQCSRFLRLNWIFFNNLDQTSPFKDYKPDNKTMLKQNRSIHHKLIGIAFILWASSCSLLPWNKEKYKSVKIGNSEWMVENLNLSTFQNGDEIPEAQTKDDWVYLCKQGLPAWCYYKNDTTNGSKYGKLYNWYAVNDIRLLAPKGWHVAKDEEWTLLALKLGGDAVAGGKLKTNQGWKPYKGAEGNGTNTHGMNVQPGGFRSGISWFGYEGEGAGFWTSNQVDIDKAKYIMILNASNELLKGPFGKMNGMSVRCVKDNK